MVAIITHPLYFQFHWLAQCALRTVREYRDPHFYVTLLDDYRNMSPLIRGSFVGCMFQTKLLAWLNQVQPGMWREGGTRESDIVCIHNPDFTFEVKTSCAKGKSINGNKVQASADKKPGFMLYVNYTQSRALKKPPIKKLCTAFCPNKLKNLAHSSQPTNHTLSELNSVCEGAASQENFAVCRVQTAVLLETSATDSSEAGRTAASRPSYVSTSGYMCM